MSQMTIFNNNNNNNNNNDISKYVVITVPLTILKDRDITFVPELPADKNRAINRIQMLGV